MSASAGNYRKVFVDSRWRISGEHNDFSIVLPDDVNTTRTASVYVASCSFSNTFETVTTGVNDKLYLITRRYGELPGVGVVPISPGKYTGATLATELQSKLRAATLVTEITVTFDAVYGTLTFSRPDGEMQFPSDGELRSALWKVQNWDPLASSSVHPYDPLNTASLNGMLYFPRPSSLKSSTTTGNIDLVPYRDVYLHSSITQFRTLKSGTGEKDCICRIPIEADFGFLNVYRHLGPSDAIACSDQHLRTVSFTFRDWQGKLVPIDQPVVLELVFLDTDPYSM